MKEMGSDLWSKILEAIKDEIGTHSFERWFLPAKMVSSSQDSITIEVPSKFFKDWLAEHYSDLIDKTAEKITGRAISIEFKIGQNPENRVEAPVFNQEPEIEQPAENHPLKKGLKDYSTLHLNQKFTFDSFVIGPCNRFSHAASLAVAESPAKAYNPLFIYGQVGLGKTHLMQAIGNHLAKKKPEIKITYISSEQFTHQLIESIQNRTTLKFREKYRKMDVLLIDDIHFIAGKESTQEEFFHTFNTLYDAHKQIVISSDRSPKDIPALEERLVSRFEWGLVTDLQPPDLETRIAILNKKAEREKIDVPSNIIYFIADRIKSNIRELEGALIRVVAYSTLMGTKITIELAQDILKDMFSETEKNITVDLIQKKVAEYFGIHLTDMTAKKRTRMVAYPRQIAMYLTRDLTDLSLPEIGEVFGGRDHTTIIHACEKVQRDLKKDQKIRNLINKLIMDLKT